MANSNIFKLIRYFFIRAVLFILLIFVALFFLYANSFKGVNKKTINYFYELKDSLRSQGYYPMLLVTSTKRAKWFNDLAVKYSGAAPKSKHLKAEAIDFVVLDINGDWKVNSKDVDIVYKILNEQIVKNKGGIGTYKNSGIDCQMIHIDCRGKRARWYR